MRPRFLLAAAAALALVASAGCGSDDSDGTSAAGQTASIPNAFGTAKVPANPKRVVAIGWSDQDTALQLGVKPVGVVQTVSTKSGVGPWVSKEIGTSRPEVLEVSDGIPFEKVAALRPDLILAVQSGIGKSDYDKLSGIAPTVAYKKGRGKFLTPWPEQTALIGQALGKPREAAKLTRDAKATIASTREKYPDWRGKTFAYTGASTPKNLNLYTGDDVRVNLMRDLGFVLPKGIAALSNGKNFFVPVSYERAQLADQDVLISWALSPQAGRTFLNQPAMKRLAVVRRGDVVEQDLTLAQAMAAPTPAAIPWALQRLAPRLQSAVE